MSRAPIRQEAADINANFAEPAIMRTRAMGWSPSPSPDVHRKRLELTGPPEAGRVTSVVRYDPGSIFPAHEHPDGEEILVLEGVFSDETGDYPAGSYLLNPEGFAHAPFSREGCVLFVKLRQYAGGDRPHIVIDTNDESLWRPHGVHGVAKLPLYEDEKRGEEIRLVRFAPDFQGPFIPIPGGEEFFVLDGAFEDENGRFETGDWLRLPPGAHHTPRSSGGCTLYIKKGHLKGLVGPG